MNTFAILALRVLLILIFAGVLVGQFLLVPALAASSAAQFPEAAQLAAPYTAVVVIMMVCVQVGLVALWVLLTMVRNRAIFRSHAIRWVDVIIAAAALATMLVMGLSVHFMSAVGSGPAVLYLGSAVVGGVAFMLLMVVMRGLLRSATALESDLDGLV